MSVAVRFAPSPTGMLHVGNIRLALINWLFARSQNGSFLLRLDDTDLERSTAEFAAGIEQDLRWLGLDWDRFARQSDRLDRYDLAKEALKRDGRRSPAPAGGPCPDRPGDRPSARRGPGEQPDTPS